MVRAHPTDPDFPGTLRAVGLAFGCDADLAGRGGTGAGGGIFAAVPCVPVPHAAVDGPTPTGRFRTSRVARFARGRIPLALVATTPVPPEALFGPVMGPGPALLPDWHGSLPIDDCLRTVPLAAWFLFSVVALQTVAVTLAPQATGTTHD